MRIPICFSMVLICAAGFAQTRITEETYTKYFNDLKDKECFLQSPGDGKQVKPEFLGSLSQDKYESKSLSNVYGIHGSVYESKSIWNQYGDFGGKYSERSPRNTYTDKAIEICHKEGGKTCVVGYLTSNPYSSFKEPVPIIDPKFLAYWLDRPKDIP